MESELPTEAVMTRKAKSKPVKGRESQRGVSFLWKVYTGKWFVGFSEPLRYIYILYNIILYYVEVVIITITVLLVKLFDIVNLASLKSASILCHSLDALSL